MITRLVWLRNDLRVTDNKALYTACSDKNIQVSTVFIATPVQWKKHNMSFRQQAFIYANILLLKKTLGEYGIPFIYHQCADFTDLVQWLKNYCYEKKINEIFYNRQYTVNENKRDQHLKQSLGNTVIFKEFDDNMMIAPGDILNNQSQMYKIYTPFHKQFIKKLIALNLNSLPSLKIIKRNKTIKNIISIPNNAFYYFQKININFPAGETAGLQKLKNFCENTVQDYITLRNYPAMSGTSFLSPYLAIGVLSPLQCIKYLNKKFPNFLENTNSGACIWLNELIWREFCHHLIMAYPFLCMHKPFINWTNNISWNNDDQHFQSWKEGLTGYPIVDAAMRQLNQTGWMHNRLRMISASFLVKHLLIDWRIGEKYFMSQLLDGDLAANNHGWQWAASTGTDSVPYFRIFNPIIQGKKFDLQGKFIRTWLPELKNIPDKYIHNPHDWSHKYQYYLDYPLPIVNHKEARKKILSIFNLAKNHHYKYIDKK